jgi:aerotaxis receptor
MNKLYILIAGFVLQCATQNVPCSSAAQSICNDAVRPKSMKINLPVTQNEYVLSDGEILVSTTDLTGRITHCNQGFVNASGFDYQELLGQEHSIVRHPDVPPEAFKDMWSTIGHGRPWTGIVKNRRKNGDHYWVQANVTPVMENGKPAAYMSVRLKPGRAQIQAAESLYALIAQQRSSGKPTFRLHAGKGRPLGWRNSLAKLNRMSLSWRFGLGLGALVGLTLLPAWIFNHIDASMVSVMQLGLGLLGAALFWRWFTKTVTLPLQDAYQLANQLACCNLDGQADYDTNHPLGSLMRRLWLVELNMRAIVADVRAEVSGLTHAAQSLVQGSADLSDRTDAQAQEVEKTSAAVEEISAAVAQTADTAQSLTSLSSAASSGASDGAMSIEQVSQSMHRIETSSRRITDIVDVIEQLAFQTNLLALNAAVEAAHAGDQGRGFAVVAAEVRALAHRSSAAAKQIRDLIQTSSQQVSDGSSTVDTAGATIRQAVDQVHLVTERLGEITLATKEESLGVAQIGEAMQLLDDVTRQNTNLVQQSRQACEALSARADTLHRAVQIFALSNG